MTIEKAQFQFVVTGEESDYISTVIDGKHISVLISDEEGVSPLYDEIMRQVDAGELTIEPADE